MPGYRVCFMNEIPRNDKLFRCCQRSLMIRSAPDAERAVEAAKQQFAKLEGIHDWKIHAAWIEVEQIEYETGPPDPIADRRAAACHRKNALSRIGPDHEKYVRHCEESEPGHASAECHRERGLPMHARP